MQVSPDSAQPPLPNPAARPEPARRSVSDAEAERRRAWGLTWGNIAREAAQRAKGDTA